VNFIKRLGIQYAKVRTTSNQWLRKATNKLFLVEPKSRFETTKEKWINEQLEVL